LPHTKKIAKIRVKSEFQISAQIWKNRILPRTLLEPCKVVTVTVTNKRKKKYTDGHNFSFGASMSGLTTTKELVAAVHVCIGREVVWESP